MTAPLKSVEEIRKTLNQPSGTSIEERQTVALEAIAECLCHFLDLELRTIQRDYGIR
jgi:hypothetical protein